jgi:hypothetical protein
MQMCCSVGFRAVVAQGRVLMVMMVDHQSMLQHLRQRLHLALKLHWHPTRHRLAEHGQQEQQGRKAFHGGEILHLPTAAT